MGESNNISNEEIKSYCGFQKNDESDKGYISYLKGVIENGKSSNTCPYVDPDTTYRNKNSEYYKAMASFLNAREKWLNEQKEGKSNDEKWKYEKWTYEFIVKEGIVVTKENKENKEKALLTLHTDQFGFSAPSNIDSGRTWNYIYPYARILRCCNYPSEYEFVTEMVYNTRTIGGSFVWPIRRTNRQKYSQYNLSRGMNSYIEDRVDITLFEIMHFYEWLKTKASKENKENDKNYNYKNDILFTSEMEEKNEKGKGTGKKKENSPMEIWLSHFGTFENYIDFFMLNDFVEIKNNQYSPINLLDNGEVNISTVNGIKDRLVAFGPVKASSCRVLSSMLTNLSNKIIERSKKMKPYIDFYETNCEKCEFNCEKTCEQYKNFLREINNTK